jgi:hypothetical protein
MKVSEWLSNLEYDSDGICITKDINNDFIKILDIRGWSTLSKAFDSMDRAALFQDSVGEFILEAINEKLENDKQKKELCKKFSENLNDYVTVYQTKLQEVFYKFINKNIIESNKFQIDNLDWCKLVKLISDDTQENVYVENEHGTHFELNELKFKELLLALESI